MSHIFLSFLFFNIILLIFYSHYKRGDYYIKKGDLVFYTIILIVFATYGGGEGDYLHYKEIVENNHSLMNVAYSNSFEPQYYYLAYLLNGNYHLWRLVIFSVQFIGMSFLMYKSKLNTYPIFICFISICLVLSVYGRSFWGQIYFFLGTYLLLEKKNPLYLIVVLLCYFSHTQNAVLLLLLPLAFINIKKWHLLLILVLFGYIVTMLQDTFFSILDSGGIDGADYVNSKMDAYSETANGRSIIGESIGERTIFILRHTPIAFLLLYLLRMVFVQKKKYILLYMPYRRIINITIGIGVVSILLIFASLGTGTIVYRVMALTFFPITILLPYLAESKIIKRKWLDLFIWIFITVSEIGYVKDLYYAYANGMGW